MDIKKFVDKVLTALFLVVSVSSCFVAGSWLSTFNSWWSMPLSGLFMLTALVVVYGVSQKPEDEYKIPANILSFCMFSQVTATVINAVLYFMRGENFYGVVIALCAIYGGYLIYLWIKHPEIVGRK